MGNPYPSGEGEKRDLSDAQGPNTSPVPTYDRVAHAKANNAKSDPSIISVGNQDGETHLQRSIHDMRDMPEVEGTIAWGHQDGEVDLKRSV